MYKKLNNVAWEEAINKYYCDNQELSIQDYCLENNLSKSQFHYHKRRLNSKTKKVPVFHAIDLGNNSQIIKNDTQALNTSLEVKITIGAASISIPVSETALINSIIKELL